MVWRQDHGTCAHAKDVQVLLRRVGALAITVLAAVALGHAFLASAVAGDGLGHALRTTPHALSARFLHGDFGATAGGGCNQMEQYHPLCSSYPGARIATMLRARVPVDAALLLGGLLLGTLLGVAGGRWCAVRPDTRRTRALHVLTALQLSLPVFFTALLVLFYLSSNVSGFIRLPFLSGQGDYVPLGESPLRYLKALWVPWLLAALPLAAFVLRITEASLREDLREDFVRTARAKGLSERRVIDRHALPVAVPAIAAMAAVNVSTLLLNVAVIEYAYNLPGMFRVIDTAAQFRDVSVLEAMVLEGVVLIVLANFAADALQAKLDPRLVR
ncbi:MAG TPA: ABC transporter permease [Solirubrobacter sp.]|nr:ABC transporter permease [Solirubrobacter sp.]